MGTHITRRSAPALLAALAGSMAGVAKAHTSPDAELLNLGRQLRAAWAAEKAAFSQPVPDDEADELVKPCSVLAERIETLPAKTLDGLRVKAEAVSWCHCGEFDGFGNTTDERIVAGMIKDLLAMAGEAI